MSKEKDQRNARYLKSRVYSYIEEDLISLADKTFNSFDKDMQTLPKELRKGCTLAIIVSFITSLYVNKKIMIRKEED